MGQTGRWTLKLPTIVFSLLMVLGCNPNRRTVEETVMRPAPEFNADSAYSFIEAQLAFGPRVPGTEAHTQCGDMLVNRLRSYGFQVTEQIDSVVIHSGIRERLRNIQGSLNPEKTERILLCAHWDSRPFADQDENNSSAPIPGANDNASGVAVLLEMARLMAENSPEVGVDMVFFDLEDQGRHANDPTEDPYDHGFCRGSEYWAKNVGENDFRYGILLDMVGGKDAVFTMEGESMKHAPDIVERVWGIGNQLGFGHHFKYNRTWFVLDDHMNVNQIAGIPCIDIIQYDASTSATFWKHWHTHEDDLHNIDRNTLKAVGQTVLQTVFNE